MTNEQMKEAVQKMANGIDVGKEPSTENLDENQKVGVAMAMAVSATLWQFQKEKLFDPAQEAHFFMHLQDFLARLYAGEDVRIGDAQQSTLRLNSLAGDMFKAATETAIKHGKLPDQPKPGPQHSIEENNVKHTLN